MGGGGAARPRYAFLGPEGTFTEAALRQVADPGQADFVPASSVLSALAAVRAGEVEFGVVPIENSVEGGVSATLDDIALGEELQILAEVLVPISFLLVGRPGAALADVRRVATHTHAWAQVRGWMDRRLPGAEFLPAPSTAAGARLLLPGEGPAAAAEGGREAGAPPSGVDREVAHATRVDAAVCAPLVAHQTGLPVLAEGIEDVTGAVTRFVLVSRPGPLPERTGADKTTLVIPLPDDHPGALREILDQFATRGINLSRIESRPTGTGMGRYYFSIDLEGHLAEARVGDALAALHRLFPDVRFLGSYPQADPRPTAVPPRHSDDAYGRAADWVREIIAR